MAAEQTTARTATHGRGEERRGTDVVCGWAVWSGWVAGVRLGGRDCSVGQPDELVWVGLACGRALSAHSTQLHVPCSACVAHYRMRYRCTCKIEDAQFEPASQPACRETPPMKTVRGKGGRRFPTRAVHVDRHVLLYCHATFCADHRAASAPAATAATVAAG